MADPTSEAHQAGGRLIADPTNATAPDYGGTVLGTMQEVALLPAFRAEEITNEEDGTEVDSLTYLGEEWVCVCVLRDLDLDALRVLFPNTTLVGGFRRIFFPGAAFTIGQDMRDRAVKLFLAPHDDEVEPAFLLAEAIPIPGESIVLNFSSYEDLSIAFAFRGVRPASGAMVDIDKASTIAGGF